MAVKHCPMCDQEMDHEEYDPSVGIYGGWYCSACDEGYPDEDEGFEDDVI